MGKLQYCFRYLRQARPGTQQRPVPARTSTTPSLWLARRFQKPTSSCRTFIGAWSTRSLISPLLPGVSKSMHRDSPRILSLLLLLSLVPSRSSLDNRMAHINSNLGRGHSFYETYRSCRGRGWNPRSHTAHLIQMSSPIKFETELQISPSRPISICISPYSTIFLRLP